MPTTNKIFRQVLFGGFNRGDVTDYIARLAGEHKREITGLTQNIDDLTKKCKLLENDASRERAARLESENTALREERDDLGAKLAEYRRLLELVLEKSRQAAQPLGEILEELESPNN